jgi:phosphocarrier protein FPr
VAAEARRALEAKVAHLSHPSADSQESRIQTAEEVTSESDDVRREIRLMVQNPIGLHARPAARFVQALQPYQLDRIEISDLTTGGGPVNARSLISVLSLDIRQGHEIRVTASGIDAPAALDALRALAATNFEDREGILPV